MRPDLDIIQKWIEPGSRVLDLGCGDGSLLAYLREHKSIQGTGLEIDETKINACLDKGVNVIQQDLNKGLTNFESQSFETVLLTQTLQAVHYPDKLVEEMLRIGKNCIVTFPNFGNWKSRAYLAFKGRMPVSDFMPYEWYDTPNIHFCTVKDFDEFCRSRDINVITRTVVDIKHRDSMIIRTFPNLLSEIAIYHFSRPASDASSDSLSNSASREQSA
ncbi:methionine biosynthesis protein MetW [Pseudohongiella spirulinae]|uniref:Methionine biosynthesis protein MetW n=1 Tax=Pseudohongiella spirulinae TaxID=1249552 RepID=A0A0S2KA27_9GAMM|nr:methionine biosynthesis protein MetW [Pseudohongiella spirulinae]ALO44850.1 Methionine biosynthesis protein MetW [Pseudohongiella spirulinae]